MSTYIGKIQLDNDSNNLIAIGDTLYGTCNTAASTTIKLVTLPEFDKAMHGVQIRVRFDYGNTSSSNVRLQIRGTSPVLEFPVVGDCTCTAGEIITFTYEYVNSTSQWRVVSGGISQTIRDYISSITNGTIEAVDNMIFKGTVGTSGTYYALPVSDYKAGWTYRVANPGQYGLRQNCEVGDIISAVASAEANQTSFNRAHWTVIQTNIDGAVIGPESVDVDGNIAIFDGTSGKLIKDSGFTIGVSVPADAKFTDENTTYTLGTTNLTAYTGNETSDTEGTVLVTVNQGVLKLAKGLKFTTTTTTVGTSLIEN